MPSKNFNLRDYLSPGGKYPYDRLAGDLEMALSMGNDVYLFSVPGFLMLAGHPDPELAERPWTDERKWYETAADGLSGKYGKKTRQLRESRPGPHWNPWPQPKEPTLEEALDELGRMSKWQIEHGDYDTGVLLDRVKYYVEDSDAQRADREFDELPATARELVPHTVRNWIAKWK